MRKHGGSLVIAGCVIISFSCAAGEFHSADSDHDRCVSLSELLRTIQFFNSGGYGCLQGSEDGYTVDAADHGCAPHNGDYNPQDWKIDLSELLRVIQLFNAGGYYCPVISEDGFAPGKDGNPYLLPVEGDTDGDGLTDEEESYLKMNPAVADEDGDGVLDGVALALQLAREIAGLPEGFEYYRWRYIEYGEPCDTLDPVTQEPITLRKDHLFNEISGDEYYSVYLPRGARFYLERGSFSYIRVNAACEWMPGAVSRIPAHNLFYLLYTAPEFLPGTHLLPVEGDSDGDYLSDAEENAIGYAVDNPDEDKNGVPDGQDLARAMAAKILSLPACYIYPWKSDHARSENKCGALSAGKLQRPDAPDKVETLCVDAVAVMCYFYDPVLGYFDDREYYITAPDASFYFSGPLLHVLQVDFSFNYYSCHYGCETHRLDVPFLYELLNMRGEIQPPPPSHLIPVENDSDGDYLSNDQEWVLDSDPENPDENSNGILDGIDLAHGFAAAVRALPRCDFPSKQNKYLFSCGKAGRAAQLDRIWNTAPESFSSKDFSTCVEFLESDWCNIYDPVLGIERPPNEYRVYCCSGDQCAYQFSVDEMMLYIMEHEGSLGFYVTENGEWVYRGIGVALWSRVLKVSTRS